MPWSPIEKPLAEHMPLTECVQAMYVRPGTLAAAQLLKSAEKKLAEARAEHERAKTGGGTMSDVGCGMSDVKKKKTTMGAVNA